MKWWISIVLLCGSHWALAIEEVIPLSVGLENDFSLPAEFEDKKITLKGTFTRVTSAVYNRQNNAIRFTPKRKGIGTLRVKEGNKILRQYTIDVRETDLNRVAHEMKMLLREIDGITVSILNNKVIVDGEIFVINDMKRIFDVVKQYGNKAANLVTLSSSAQNKLARFMEREIGNPNITIKAANGRFILRGTVTKPEERDNAVLIAKLYAPGVLSSNAVKEGVVRERDVANVIINLIKVNTPPKDESKKEKKLIQIIVHYVELDRSYDDLFRFQWQPTIEDGSNISYGASAAGETFGIISGTISNFIPKLNWAKSFGFARVLHSSNVVVKEEATGVVTSGSKIPYSSLSGPQGGSVTQFAQTGIQMNIKPTIIGSRRDGVSLEVSFDVSSVSGSAGGQPIINNKNVKTILQVRSGLSAAIGGVITNNVSRGFNRQPAGSGQAQPLFNLFASKEFSRSQNQFVVFVTPVIKSSASVGVEQIKKKFRID